MIAVDTNVMLRLILCNDQPQLARTLALHKKHDFWVSTTVVLEIEWVLRAKHTVDKDLVLSMLDNMLEIERVHFENKALLKAAVAQSLKGMDFADALHLLQAPEGVAFATFDKKLAKRATGVPHKPVLLLAKSFAN